MNHPSKRLSEVISALGHNVNSFSLACGYATSHTIWSIIKNKKTPSNPTYDRICKIFPEINRGFISNGTGEMFVKKAEPNLNGELTATANQVIIDLSKKLEDQSTLIISNMLRADLVHEAQSVISKLSSVLEDFKNIKKQGEENKDNLASINEKLASIELIETIKEIEDKTKKRSGRGLDLN